MQTNGQCKQKDGNSKNQKKVFEIKTSTEMKNFFDRFLNRLGETDKNE
jgi:hypothetical protein